MGSVKEYFTSLGQGIKSLVQGMEVTGKEFVTPKITERYPENRETHKIPERFRAELHFNYDDEGRHKCIACGICERACPNGTITVQTKMVETPDGKKKKKLDKYIYDLGSCTFCQLCVTNCPTGAIGFDNDFEQAVYTRSKLVKQLNYLPEKEEPAPAPKSAAPKPAAAPAPASLIDENDPKVKAALAKCAGDPEKEAKVREALEKAARLKAEKAKAAAPAASEPKPAAEKSEPKSPEK